MKEMTPERMQFLSEWVCRPAKPKRRPRTWLITTDAGLPDRMAYCSMCHREVGYTDTFGFSGHTRAGAPTFEEWCKQQQPETFNAVRQLDADEAAAALERFRPMEGE